MNHYDSLLSIIAPVYNETGVINEFHKQLVKVLRTMECQYEILYINDGSTDDSLALINSIRQRDSNVRILDLSRNFGKEIAMSAGLDFASGDAVIIIDTDLQDPPAVIPELFTEWKNGFDVVYARRISRDGESIFKKITASVFYKLIGNMSNVNIPKDTGDFRLLSRRAVVALVKLREQHRFMKGLFSWVGYSQKEVLYHRDKRFAGDTKWNYWKLWNFAIEGLTSFSTIPLKVFSYVGMLVSSVSFLYACFVAFRTLIFGDPVQGYPSMIIIILFLGGIQLVGIGILGEYLGRVFNETKNRPLYFLQKKIGFADENTMNRPTHEEEI